MRKSGIVIIGAAILDVLAAPVDAEVFESGSYPAQDIRMASGGDALNEAIVLRGLGAQVTLETVIGADMAGEFLREYCRRQGIAIGQEQVRRGLATGINVVLVEENGERSFVTNANGSLRSLELSDIRMPFPQNAGILCFASIYVFPKLRTKELISLFKSAKEQGMVVCADMTKRKNEETLTELAPALFYVDYLFANETEAELITGEPRAEQSAGMLWRSGAKHVIIKCGARGCYIKSELTEREIEAESDVKCIDTTGAGDSFVAGFLFALSQRKDFVECAKYANWCGARAVEHIGATTWITK